jgi:predicted Zn finger-like uncharacterized protein
VQISCERCGTTYALDERLIPPGGAPVQCTRCSHVFTAMPPGAAPPPAASLPHAGNKTQLFGTAASAAPAPPAAPAAPAARSNTQMFGTAAAASPRPSGLKPAGQMPAAPSISTTQVFGMAPEPPPPGGVRVGGAASAPRQPQVFASAPAPALPPEPRTTQMYGGSQPPPPAAPPAPSISSTQVFGMLPDLDPPAPAARGSTQLYAGAGPAPTTDPAAPAAPSISTTQVFGSLPPSLTGEAAPPARGRTTTEQQFAAVQAPRTTSREMEAVGFEDTVRSPRPQPGAKPGSLGSVDASMATTQMLGAPDEAALEKIWASQATRLDRPAVDRGAPTPLETPAQRLVLESLPTPVAGVPAVGFHSAATPVETPAVGRIELPPEPPSFAAGVGLPPEPPTTPEMEAARLEQQIRRRNRIALFAVVGLVAVIAIGAGARMLLGRQRAVPPDALAQRESARLLVRRDDIQSRQRATEELTFLTARHPAYLAAQADLVVALALQLDDARLAIKRLGAEADELNRQIARLQEEKVPGDWQNRVNVKIDRLGEIKRQSDPLVERATALDARVNDAFRALEALQKQGPPGPEDQLALARAQAIYFGVKGSEQAIALGERYRAAGGNDGWADVAYAEFALNARVPPETVGNALGAMERLAAADATFLRSYVLSARLAMAQKRYGVAVTSLESALALNPAHEVARDLLEWARTAEQEAATRSSAP